MTQATLVKLTRATTVTMSAALAAIAVSALGSRETKAAAPAERTPSVERGAYLVRAMGCNHCHTPYRIGPSGPEPDMSRALSGHPADFVMPAPPRLDERWNWAGASTNTAFVGPWGVSFTANLTPDPETGLGRWSAETFIATMRTGRHEGKGRPVLPPMPVENLAALDDSDIRDLFAYLQSLPPIRNRVPAPLDPPEDAR
jgi:mono/diheme cytochrome c family protein